jgi:hypothetical protein
VTVPSCVLTYLFTGPLSPIDADGTSDFRGNRPSVPVRFKLTTADGSPITDADARLFVAPVSAAGTVGAYLPAASDDWAGNRLIYDRKHRYYELPLATRSMHAGVWSLRITVNGQIAREFRITLIKK